MHLFTGGNVFCQSSRDLEKKKLDNISKLNYSRKLLDQTAESKNTTLNQLNLIQQNIELRLVVMDNISDELSFLMSDIESNKREIIEIERKISNLKNDYSRLIIAASKNLDSDYALMYIFSSLDFNQAYQRVKYLKYLARYRSDMVEKLQAEKQNLNIKNSELIENKKKNERLLYERKMELLALDRDRERNITLIHSLQKKEGELKKEIKERERIQSEIEKEIRRIIEEEAARVRNTKGTEILTPEQKLISSDFNKNRGRLPWPSEQGVLTGKYGDQNHPVLKGVKIRNNGIDINTVPGTEIRSIFDGEVTKVIAILGANYTVIIKHGEYRTVYQNLIDVKVKAGDKIKTKSVIGTVFTDQENASRLHFELWKDKLTQNPELWLSK